MKKYFFICSMGGMLFLVSRVDAVVTYCNSSACSYNDTGYIQLNAVANCWNGLNANPSATCYDNYMVLTCSFGCADGYEEKTKSVSVPCTGGTVSYTTCQSVCAECADCTSDTAWSAAGTGYQKKVTRTCNCGTCNEATSYRCAAGYYGSSSNGTSGCTRCPSSGGVYGTSAAGSTAITSCYMPSGTSVSFSDVTGSGTAKYTSNCYYTN